MIRFERPRVAMDFRALSASLDGIDPPGVVQIMTPDEQRAELAAALKAHINTRVQAGRVRRGHPIGSFFDLEDDACCPSLLHASQDESAA